MSDASDGKSENVSAPQAIIIVRRKGGGHDDGHHGGAWKIAYADFMTAMMAFFLVMWLVNSTDQKTIVQVAAYFNPIRLSDKVPSERGLQDGTISAPNAKGASGAAQETRGDKSTDALSSEPAESKKKDSKRDAKKKAEREQQMFEDPIKALNDLSANARTPLPTVAAQPPKIQVAEKENAILDPFERASAIAQDQTVKNARGSVMSNQPAGSQNVREHKVEIPPRAADINSVHAGNAEKSNKISTASDHRAAPETPLEIIAELKAAASAMSGPMPHIDVNLTPDGVLLSLSDHTNFGMFNVGSAEPRPEFIVVMEKIATILRARAGSIIVRGHTDNRPYRSFSYDNWRLSSARAQMAYYMLVRGGVDELRIERIEGYADRSPRNMSDGGAAENRRIDIMLRYVRE